ncbi:MAG: DUF2780 domain-containing protein [Deltaproteobacteria bacterium]|nr:MAG: DUF2780 domain-containing protein [Deltaproteobacteria bacterium]
MMKILTLPNSLVLVFILVFLTSQPVRADMMKSIPLLTQSLGVTESQAKGGTGVIFDHVKQKVSAEDFAQVAKALSGVDSLVDLAPKASDLSRQIGGLSPALGGKSDLTGGMAGVAQRFGKLGLDAGMVDKYVKMILDFAQSEAGTAVTNIIKSSLV